MKRIAGVLGALLLFLGSPDRSLAQSDDALVLPPGVLRVSAGGTFRHFDSRFTTGDSTAPLAADLLRPLDSVAFPPLRPLEAGLGEFFAATAGTEGASPVQVGPETVRLGTPDVRISVSERRVPFGVRLGILPRVELGVVVPVVQRERLVQRLGLPEATVGPNPDTAGNREILAGIDAAWAGLGGSRLLPVDSSALGRELQRRVEALTGEELALPAADTTGAAALQALLVEEYGLPALTSGLGSWELGDVEVAARVQLLNTLPPLAYPGDSAGVELRSAVSVGLRLPTGNASDSLRLFGFEPVGGRTGLLLGTENDLFWGERFWGTVAARYALLQEVETERRIVPPGEPLSSTEPAVPVTWSPGAELELKVVPRFRLTDEIALGAHYSLLRVGAARYERLGDGSGGAPAGVLDTEAATVQRVGGGLRYSTLPAYVAGHGVLPFEISLALSTTLTGSARVPAASAVVIRASVFRTLWGGR